MIRLLQPPILRFSSLLTAGLATVPATVLVLSAPIGAQEDIQEPPGLSSIQSAELEKWAMYLASDELEGRLTGSRGQQLAASYIAKHFEALGLEPLGDTVEAVNEGEVPGRGFLQKYPLTRVFLDRQTTGITLGEGEAAKTFHRGFAMIPGRGKEKDGTKVAGQFVYAGLANTRAFKKGVELEDWSGKIPVFVIDVPKSSPKMGIEQQMGMGMFLLASLKRRADKLAKRGAEVAVFCIFDDSSSVTNMLTYMAVAPGQDMMQNKRAGGAGGMGTMMRMMEARVPTVFLSRKLSTALVEQMGTTAEAASVQIPEEAVAALKTPEGEVNLGLKVDDDSFATNVVAVLRGTDPDLSKEAVIYSAHMDHVGMRLDGDAYNGADDNASGSAGLMAIAKAFANGKRPRRSIIFLSVSGEELGLWGSAHYAKNPTWPIENIVANVNTDMIGRNGPESTEMTVTVTPSYRHNKFSTIVRDSAKIGEAMGMSFSNGDKYYSRSDHYNFAREGIPVVFFCNGEHVDYHQVSDHPEKLDVGKMTRISKLAYWTGYNVAQADERPTDIGRSSDWQPKK